MCVFSVHLIHVSGDGVFPVIEEAPNVALRESFLRRLAWQSLDNTQNETQPDKCRNTIQVNAKTKLHIFYIFSQKGKDFICDERGYLCDRRELSPTGCCPESSLNTDRFSCANCDRNNCCQIYEVCVSCCLQPDNKVRFC